MCFCLRVESRLYTWLNSSIHKVLILSCNRIKDSFIDFIEQVDNISKEYDKIQTLSNTLVTAHEQLKDKNNKIKTLTENNEALDLRIKTLNDTIKEKDNEMYDDNVLDDDDIEELDLNKEKDDFER